MKLTVLSNYGSQTSLVSNVVTIDQIKETMQSINWDNFHQVILEQSNGNYIEVSGNLASDGLSVMYQEGRKQFFTSTPPSTVEAMTTILLSYYAGDGNYKTRYVFE